MTKRFCDVFLLSEPQLHESDKILSPKRLLCNTNNKPIYLDITVLDHGGNLSQLKGEKIVFFNSLICA